MVKSYVIFVFTFEQVTPLLSRRLARQNFLYFFVRRNHELWRKRHLLFNLNKIDSTVWL